MMAIKNYEKKDVALLQEYYKWYYNIMYSVFSSLITVVTI